MKRRLAAVAGCQSATTELRCCGNWRFGVSTHRMLRFLRVLCGFFAISAVNGFSPQRARRIRKGREENNRRPAPIWPLSSSGISRFVWKTIGSCSQITLMAITEPSSDGINYSLPFRFTVTTRTFADDYTQGASTNSFLWGRSTDISTRI